jgi:hypothetical protein
MQTFGLPLRWGEMRRGWGEYANPNIANRHFDSGFGFLDASRALLVIKGF